MFDFAYTGHFYEGALYQFDDKTDTYIEPPKYLRFRPHDVSARDIGTNIKTELGQQDLQGYALNKHTMVIQVLDDYVYTTRDRFKDLTDGQTYAITKVEKGYDSIKSITNLMFKNTGSKPTILYLGDING